jgi:hypothetical protein
VRCRRKDRLDDTAEIRHDLRVPEAQHEIASVSQPGVPQCVAAGLPGPLMSATVELDYQPGRMAGEIDDIRPDRRLPAEC